jgi:RNA polymerase sigma-70 factor (ECF subfamily)
VQTIVVHFGPTWLNHLVRHDIQLPDDAETSRVEAIMGAGVQYMNVAEKPAANSEEILVERARQADTRAFEALYRAHSGKVYGLCLRMTGNRAEAEDCAQEAFIQAWKKLDRFRGDSSFGTWMHRVAVNVVLGRMRSARREHDRMEAVNDVHPPRESIGDSGSVQDLEAALNQLPSGARHVFVLHAVYGYSHEETGAMLDIAAGTSKAQLHRAKRLLQQQLESVRDEQ